MMRDLIEIAQGTNALTGFDVQDLHRAHRALAGIAGAEKYFERQHRNVTVGAKKALNEAVGYVLADHLAAVVAVALADGNPTPYFRALEFVEAEIYRRKGR